MLGTPELNAVVHVRSHNSGVERENNFPRLLGYASPRMWLAFSTQPVLVLEIATVPVQDVVFILLRSISQACHGPFGFQPFTPTRWVQKFGAVGKLAKSALWVSYPPNGPSIKAIFLQFRDKDIVWDYVKCFCINLLEFSKYPWHLWLRFYLLI